MKTTQMLIGIFLLSLLGCKSPDNKTTDSQLKVYVLDGGYFDFRDYSFFSNDSAYVGKRKIFENGIFLIEHKNGRLIWDVGLPDSYADRDPAKVDTTGSYTAYIREKLIDQLKTMEINPDSIDYLSVSHTHFDHIGNGNYFKNSTWIVNENEFNWAFREGANTTNYDGLHNSKRQLFKDAVDVFNDSTVVIYSLPGHTPGHSCLSIKLKNQYLLLTGDLYHFNEQREHKRVPTFNTDKTMTLESMERFEALAKKLNAKVIIQHERKVFESLPKFPEYLE